MVFVVSMFAAAVGNNGGDAIWFLPSGGLDDGKTAATNQLPSFFFVELAHFP